MSIFSSQDHTNLLDELMSGNTSDVRKAKILSDLIAERESVHKTITENEEKYVKLEEESQKLVDVNRKMMSEMFSGDSPKTFGSPKEKSFHETITIEQIEKNNRSY